MKNIELEEIKNKIKTLELSEIQSRLNEIANIFNSNEKTVIDKLIPLNEEANILLQESEQRLGKLDAYFEEKGA